MRYYYRAAGGIEDGFNLGLKIGLVACISGAIGCFGMAAYENAKYEEFMQTRQANASVDRHLANIAANIDFRTDTGKTVQAKIDAYIKENKVGAEDKAVLESMLPDLGINNFKRYIEEVAKKNLMTVSQMQTLGICQKLYASTKTMA